MSDYHQTSLISDWIKQSKIQAVHLYNESLGVMAHISSAAIIQAPYTYLSYDCMLLSNAFPGLQRHYPFMVVPDCQSQVRIKE